MNERIKELAEQAGVYFGEATVDRFGDKYPAFVFTREMDIEKFAELIVQECADISDASFHNGSAGYLAILKHFGVE